MWIILYFDFDKCMNFDQTLFFVIDWRKTVSGNQYQIGSLNLLFIHCILPICPSRSEIHMFGRLAYILLKRFAQNSLRCEKSAIFCLKTLVKHFWTRKPHINISFDYITAQLILKWRELNYHCIAQKEKKWHVSKSVLNLARNRLEAFGNNNNEKSRTYLHICAISMFISFGL